MTQTMLDVDVVKAAVQLACRAPSIHNSQPWHWVLDGPELQLFVDRAQRVSVADRSGREAIISCGAMLDHLCVAMAAAGWDANVFRFPDPDNQDHLATIYFSPLEFVTETQCKRAEAILERRSDRLPLRRPTFWTWLVPTLRKTVGEQAMFDVLSDEVRAHLASASHLTKVLRGHDASYQDELHWWTSPFMLSQGITPESLPSKDEAWRLDVQRDFPAGHGERRQDLGVDWSHILVLSTAGDTPSEAFACGEALSRVLLECTMTGLATCPLTHLIELEESRDIVRGLINRQGMPQVLIRVGIAPPMENLPAATPRRPLDDVLDIRL